MADQAANSKKKVLWLFDAREPRFVALSGGLLVLIWLLLGKIGLILVGMVVGVILQSWWNRYQLSPLRLGFDSNNGSSHHESGIQVVHSLINWQSMKLANTAGPDDSTHADGQLDFSISRPATASALAALADTVIQQYIEWWYKPILPSEAEFPLACRNSLVRFFQSISSHLSLKRPADSFIHFLINSSSIIIVFLGELATALAGENQGSTFSTAESLHSYLHRFPGSNLSSLLSIDKQQEKLRLISTDILQVFLDPQLYNCEIMRTFFREMLSGVILESIIESCSKPEFINGWIVHYLEGTDAELINALDVGIEQARTSPTQLRSNDLEDQVASGLSARLSGCSSEDAARHNPHEDSSSDPLKVPNIIPDGVDRNLASVEDKVLMSPAGRLRGANVSVLEGYIPDGGQGYLSTKPAGDYLLQIEPTNSLQSGWMVARQYADFEALDYLLRQTVPRLEFCLLPVWKGQTHESLRRDLEHYLHSALKHEAVADSEATMKFLDKSLESGDLLRAFSETKRSISQDQVVFSLGLQANARISSATGVISRDPPAIQTWSHPSGLPRAETSEPPVCNATEEVGERACNVIIVRSDNSSAKGQSDPDNEKGPPTQLNKPKRGASPTAGPGSIDSSPMVPTPRIQPWSAEGPVESAPSHLLQKNAQRLISRCDPKSAGPTGAHEAFPQSKESEPSEHMPLSEAEAAIAVELIFAVINELYGLSSVWKIRKAILNAAKSFLLRPGNQGLEFMRNLIQHSVSENISDEALAGYITTVRERCFGLIESPEPLSDREKDDLKAKARSVLVTKGMPPALANVMGTTATVDALGTLFDSLQIQSVARSLVFLLVIQALKILLQ